MKRRLIESIGVLAVLVAVSMLLKLAPVAGQSQSEPAPGPAALTAWGEPNLEGIWTTDYQTPLERPARYADREFFTEEERAAIDSERARVLALDRRRDARGSEQDVGGAYSAAIFLSHKHLGRRTSLIVDPPNGRLPELTPEAAQRRDEIREYQLALLQATNVCKDNLPACAGGEYGPPSPRRFEPPPTTRPPARPPAAPSTAPTVPRTAACRSAAWAPGCPISAAPRVSSCRWCRRPARCRSSTTPARGRGGSA